MFRSSLMRPCRPLQWVIHTARPTRIARVRMNSSLSAPPVEPFEPSFAAQQKPSFWRPVLFVVGVSGGAFAVAAYATNQDTQKWTKKLGQGSWWRYSGPNSQEMQRARKFAMHKELTERLKKVVEETKELPAMLRVYYQRLWISAAELRLNASDGRRLAAVLIGVNLAVFLAWQIPFLRPRMMSGWLHSPLSGKTYTLLTSTFSHNNFVHLTFNMFALFTFGSAAFDWLGAQQMMRPDRLKESTYENHCLAFYMTGGLFSALVSHVITTQIRLPRLIAAALSSSATARATASSSAAILPSLGASGAIYSTVTLAALALPNAMVSIIFLPWISVPISVGVSAAVMIDVVGVLRGWRMFDHWAHLGGATFGVMYFYYGPQAWNWMRKQVELPQRYQQRVKKES